jgi:hypothetical protein
MAKQLGSNATIEVSTDGLTYTKAFRVKKASADPSNTSVDSTDNDDNGYKSKLYGDQEVPASFTCNYDPSDPGQIIVINAARSKTKIFIRYRSRGTGSGLPQGYGMVVVKKAVADSEHEKVQELSVDCDSDGAWTFGNQ